MRNDTVRNSSFELLRIVCMLMIIGGHIIMQHKTAFDVKSADFAISLFMRGAFAVAVNAFILISGYFGVNFKWKRLLKLEMQTLFYSVLLLGVAIGTGMAYHQSAKRHPVAFPCLIQAILVCYLLCSSLHHRSFIEPMGCIYGQGNVQAVAGCRSGHHLCMAYRQFSLCSTAIYQRFRIWHHQLFLSLPVGILSAPPL